LVLSISALLLLAATVAVLCRWAGLRTWHACVCILLGFYLAHSALAPAIGELARTVAGLITGH